MITLTYLDAYQIERSQTYPDLAACLLAFSGCVTLPDYYTVHTLTYKDQALPFTGKIGDLYPYLKALEASEQE